MAIVTGTLTLTVTWDDGGYDDFDPDAILHYLVKYAAEQGLLTGEDGPITVESYEAKVVVE